MVSAVRLNALLDDLDRAGLDAGPSARQQAHMLYMLLATDQSLAADHAERRLIDHLRPLIIRSREQSAAFERVVSQWGVEAPAASVGLSGASSAPEATSQQSADLPKARRRFPIAWLGIAALAALICLIIWVISQPLAPTPNLEPGTAGINQTPSAQSGTTQPLIIGEEIEVDASEALPQEDNRLDGDTLELLLAYHFLKHDFAPTLRELQATGLFGDLSLEEVNRLSGYQPDVPLPLNKYSLIRLLRIANLPISQPENVWESLAPTDAFERAEDWLMSPEGRIEIYQNLSSLEPDFYRQNGLAPLEDEALMRGQIAVETFAEIEQLARPFRETMVFENEGETNVAADFSHDGTRIAVAATSGSVKVFDTATGALVLTLGEGVRTEDGTLLPDTPHAAFVRSVVFSPDDQLLLTASADGTARLWNAATGELVSNFESHTDEVSHAFFANNPSRIVTSSFDGTVQLRSISIGTVLRTFPSHRLGVWHSDISSDDRRLLTGARDGQVRLWDAQTGDLLETWDAHPTEVTSITFSKDDTRFLSSDVAGIVKISDVATGEALLEFVGHDQYVANAYFSPDEKYVVTASEGDNSVRIWDAETADELMRFEYDGRVSWADFSKDGTRIVSLGTEATIRLIDKNPSDLFPGAEAKIWTTDTLADTVRDRLANAFDGGFADDITNADIVRQTAAIAHQRGDTLLVRDPPWQSEARSGLHEPHAMQVNAPIFAALTLALIGIGAWLWSAFNMRAYLQRRRPGDPGRVIELFSDTRHQADKVQNAIRRAAKALLQRQPGHQRLDIKASVKATAKARGLFTPVEKRDTRMPEYLFLIDARSRADHETQRTLDYLDRLRKEHVPITHYFYERAPDRVRASMGAPAQSLELIASEHSGKRLVLVGDAASMFASNRSGSGAWKKTLESWQSKSFVTTVPVAEWGLEEAKFTQETGLVANVLSAEGLEALPTALFAERMVGQAPTQPPGMLDVPPLPSLLRRDPERWILDASVDPDEWLDLQTALVGYLSVPGWRWLCACAVYPVIEWDLTVALGQVLKGATGDPLYSESLAARLSELPWMRAGEMPDWLRARLIGEIDAIDREAVRGLIAMILDAVASERKTGGDAISLKFGYLQGREPDSDERFVDFVTRAPESMDENALEATRKLRQLLRLDLFSRLVDPGALGWLLIGVSAAFIAWLIAPRYVGAPLHTGAWAPLFAMLVGPVLAWLIWRWSKRFWTARSKSQDAAREVISDAPRAVTDWIISLSGWADRLAQRNQNAPPPAYDGLVRLMRRRVEVWAMVPMVLIGGAGIYFGVILLGFIWNAIYGWNTGWMTALRTWWLGEIGLTLLMAVVLYLAGRLVWWGLKWQYLKAVQLTDFAALQRQDLAVQRAGRLSRAGFMIGAILVVSFIMVLLNLVLSQVPLDAMLSNALLFGSALTLMLAIPAWHAWTLRRFARALERAERPIPHRQAEMKQAKTKVAA